MCPIIPFLGSIESIETREQEDKKTTKRNINPFQFSILNFQLILIYNRKKEIKII